VGMIDDYSRYMVGLELYRVSGNQKDTRFGHSGSLVEYGET
jgi:hypothetical protein